jgi:glycosyltransferase involved in cell wall biosynthesis
MTQGDFTVQRAFAEYRQGNYAAALQAYRQLADKIGGKYFKVNIDLCLRNLKKSLGQKDYAGIALTKVRVAAVMDEFTYASYKDTCILQQLSVDHWEAELNELEPDFLFIESAWRGKDDAWNRKISQASPELIGALNWCKERSIPTMFWNKEDPVHFGTFLNTAKRFDIVFTTDLNCIGNYKRDLGHDRVYLLPFGCNPVEHNPIEKYSRKPKSCFAGSYYVRYPERIRDLDVLLETFIEHSGVDIYDRNFGKEDVNYAFPDKYTSLILGNLKYDQIDLAYKGYEYGINLNSVKYSPTMFARRVFELLASRTLVVSNYSQGVRLFFGDLVMCSDAKSEIISKTKKLAEDLRYAERIKLTGLRKVMTEHTYEQRFSYITEKVLGRPRQEVLPSINVLAIAKTQDELNRAIEVFTKQQYQRKKLIALAVTPGLKVPKQCPATITLIENIAVNSQWINFPVEEFATFINSANEYGEHYLTDLAIATKYTNAEIIAKGTLDQGTRATIGSEYTFSNHYYPDAALVSGKHLAEFLAAIGNGHAGPYKAISFDNGQVFITDHHNFSPAKAVGHGKSQPFLDTGLNMNNLLQHAEAIPPAKTLQIKTGEQDLLQGNQLHKLLNIVSAKQRGIVCSIHETGLKIDVAADAESPYYIYTNAIHPLTAFWKNLSGKLYLDTTLGLELAPVIRFYDSDKNRLNHAILISNWNQFVNIPGNAPYCQLGIRVAGGPGRAIIKNWVFDHASQEHRFNWVPSSKTLLISANYPHYDDYYRYAFVHRRVKGYKDHGLKTDVFRFRQSEDLGFYEFEDIDVVSGGQDILNTVLKFSQYSTIAIHALDRFIWDVVLKVIDKTKIIIWLHGAEIQSWKRRMFNYANQQEIDRARGNGEMRDAFWRSVFRLNHPNIHFVFVSNYFKEETLNDLGVTCNPANMHIVHNPIDTDLFKFIKKDPAQRKKILSIRPYASRVYANDLMVKSIVELSSRPYFNELEFKVVGDGLLFDETVEPLKQFKNVTLVKRFLSQSEIADLHRDYGIFLCPSRMDTQGVSRDEAMASGLVPITNKVGAISKFVSADSGFLCEAEDYKGLARAIETLYKTPELFTRMSAKSATEVRETRSSKAICPDEVALLKS